jgi:SNF2 family DNA or RNA helicase
VAVSSDPTSIGVIPNHYISRFDGAMDQKARAAVVDEFAKPRKTPQIMLISLKAGGVGLNL